MASGSGDDRGWGYQEYRVSEWGFGRLLGAMALAAPILLVVVCADAESQGPEKVVVLVATLAVLVAIAVSTWLSRTVRGPDGIVVRGLLRTRTFGWPDIQDIRIESSPAGQLGIYEHLGVDGPRLNAYLYDGAGRRVTLPNLNEKNVAALGFTLAAEVETMRATWQRQRGPQWASLPRARSKIDYRARYPFASWMVGMTAAMLAVPVAAVLVVVGLFTHAAELPAPLSWLFRPEFILVLPAVVVPVATMYSRLARRRATPR
jgi:hypothetical protein